MFVSQFSGKQFGPGVSPVRVVIKKRSMSYMNFQGDRSNGWEIAQELVVAPEEVEAVQQKYDGNFEKDPKYVEQKQIRKERRERERY